MFDVSFNNNQWKRQNLFVVFQGLEEIKKKLKFSLFFFLGKRKPSTFHFDVGRATSLSCQINFYGLEAFRKKKIVNIYFFVVVVKEWCFEENEGLIILCGHTQTISLFLA